jgi:hypothetical protein
MRRRLTDNRRLRSTVAIDTAAAAVVGKAAGRRLLLHRYGDGDRSRVESGGGRGRWSGVGYLGGGGVADGGRLNVGGVLGLRRHFVADV